MNDLAFNFASALAVAGSAFVGLTHIVPRPILSDYFDVAKLTAVRQGNTALLTVDRTIKQPLHMGFTVRVLAEGREGWVEHCAMTSGTILYQPGRSLPDPVTLDWWTWGRCPTLPAGRALIETTWAPEGGLAPLTMTIEVGE
jgi:hypothetical protein